MCASPGSPSPAPRAGAAGAVWGQLCHQGGKASPGAARNATAIAKQHYMDRDTGSEGEMKLSWEEGSVE